MDKVTTDIRLRNHIEAMSGVEHPRGIEIKNAIVDSRTSMLSLSKDIIDALGLKKIDTRKVDTATGIEELDVYGTVELDIMGREDVFSVMELKHPAIKAPVRQQPLELFDLLIHPSINRLIPNPEHDRQLILDMLTTNDIIEYKG